MRSFLEMWEYTKNVYGSFTISEARAMYEVVSKLPRHSVVVEIGSYCGRSSSLIGQLAAEPELDLDFTCVDNFITSWEGKDVEQEFRKNMIRPLVKFQLLTMSSRRASHLFDDEEVNVLFIDGDHTYEGAQADITLWLPKMDMSGTILFHDYNSSWDGVKKAVEDSTLHVSEVIDSLGIVKKL